MTCDHCNGTDWYELDDGRSRCSVCFATVEVKREKAAAQPKDDDTRTDHS